ncbi:serine hydrolase domain-containing protein [Aquihabitans daechungensis]|uniref:serine hydrolase domain-containing protein n=1 Tax=Aquihabitans daechungensis TaxID=1052257 RepID=UPI003BA22F0C
MSIDAVEVQGTVAPGFEPVADAFAANFVEHGEVGAACAVRVGGEEVVDIWAGVADPATGRPYEADTLQLVFSSTKGVVAAAAHVLIDRGLLDPDAPVAEYWPEFAANGKGHIPVRWILGHRSGVIGIDRVLSVEEFTSWDPFVEALAAAEPLWEPDTAHGYHALSFGFLVGELVRRITGTDIGTFVREQVAAPVGAEFHIGVPDAELPRVAPLIGAVMRPDEAPSEVMVALLTGGTPTNRAFMIAPVLPTSFNEPEILRPRSRRATAAPRLAAWRASTAAWCRRSTACG